MHCQKPSCLNALSCLIFVAFSRGSLSKIVFLLFISLKKFLLTIKKPPFIQLVLIVFFSLKLVTLFCLIINSPNLGGGLTAVTVISFFFFLMEVF